jgi:hypothetical protein
VAFTAFLDTNAIYGEYLCDTLLRLAEAGTYRPQWSAGVLEELERNLAEEAGLASEAVRRRIGAMRRAFPDAEVRSFFTDLLGITCTSASNCIAVGEVSTQRATAARWNGKSWSSMNARNP